MKSKCESNDPLFWIKYEILIKVSDCTTEIKLQNLANGPEIQKSTQKFEKMKYLFIV